MKKVFIFIILTVLFLSAIIVTCVGQDPKVLACEKGCEKAKQECYDKAGDDAAAKIACDAAEAECKDKCNE